MTKIQQATFETNVSYYSEISLTHEGNLNEYVFPEEEEEKKLDSIFQDYLHFAVIKVVSYNL